MVFAIKRAYEAFTKARERSLVERELKVKGPYPELKKELLLFPRELGSRKRFLKALESVPANTLLELNKQELYALSKLPKDLKQRFLEKIKLDPSQEMGDPTPWVKRPTLLETVIKIDDVDLFFYLVPRRFEGYLSEAFNQQSPRIFRAILGKVENLDNIFLDLEVNVEEQVPLVEELFKKGVPLNRILKHPTYIGTSRLWNNEERIIKWVRKYKHSPKYETPFEYLLNILPWDLYLKVLEEVGDPKEIVKNVSYHTRLGKDELPLLHLALKLGITGEKLKSIIEHFPFLLEEKDRYGHPPLAYVTEPEQLELLVPLIEKEHPKNLLKILAQIKDKSPEDKRKKALEFILKIHPDILEKEENGTFYWEEIGETWVIVEHLLKNAPKHIEESFQLLKRSIPESLHGHLRAFIVEKIKTKEFPEGKGKFSREFARYIIKRSTIGTYPNIEFAFSRVFKKIQDWTTTRNTELFLELKGKFESNLKVIDKLLESAPNKAQALKFLLRVPYEFLGPGAAKHTFQSYLEEYLPQILELEFPEVKIWKELVKHPIFPKLVVWLKSLNPGIKKEASYYINQYFEAYLNGIEEYKKLRYRRFRVKWWKENIELDITEESSQYWSSFTDQNKDVEQEVRSFAGSRVSFVFTDDLLDLFNMGKTKYIDNSCLAYDSNNPSKKTLIGHIITPWFKMFAIKKDGTILGRRKVILAKDQKGNLVAFVEPYIGHRAGKELLDKYIEAILKKWVDKKLIKGFKIGKSMTEWHFLSEPKIPVYLDLILGDWLRDGHIQF